VYALGGHTRWLSFVSVVPQRYSPFISTSCDVIGMILLSDVSPWGLLGWEGKDPKWSASSPPKPLSSVAR
jgi:hypothetical protein